MTEEIRTSRIAVSPTELEEIKKRKEQDGLSGLAHVEYLLYKINR